MGAEVAVTTEPRFSGRVLGIIAGAVAVLLLGAAGVMISTSHILARTSTTLTNADGSRIRTETTQYAAAGFAVASLIVLGALIVLAGVVLALAELVTVTRGTGKAPDDPEEGQEAYIPGAATGAAAIAESLGELARGLGEAIKGLKASGITMVVGAVVMIFGGIVAWQTVPGTNTDPRITVVTPAPAPATTDVSAPPASPGTAPPTVSAS